VSDYLAYTTYKFSGNIIFVSFHRAAMTLQVEQKGERSKPEIERAMPIMTRAELWEPSAL
jgi:hypothetical protein